MNDHKVASAQVPPYPLRMPIELRERLEKAAQQNMRSLNAEILFRLQQAEAEVKS